MNSRAAPATSEPAVPRPCIYARVARTSDPYRRIVTIALAPFLKSAIERSPTGNQRGAGLRRPDGGSGTIR
jgi:hypothetical protein